MHAMLTRGMAALTLAAGLALPAAANTFRFAYQGDINSMDPYALNETFTHSILANVYEGLVARGKNLEIVPALAESWSNPAPDRWLFKLRRNVRFHDGAAFDADDVLFSYQRAIKLGSDIAPKLYSVKELRKIDSHTVEFVTDGPNPILTSEIATWFIFDKEWSEKNGAVDPSSVPKKVENYATRFSNGTGPFMQKAREPGIKTVLVPNPHWWGKPEHNLTEIVFTPIGNNATRVAALLSGDVDMVYPVPLQDVPRLKSRPDLRSLQGHELRTLYLGMDVARDELLESNVKGRNPFKDLRVRKAFYHAIDIEAIKDKVMRGASTPTGLMVGPGINGFNPALNDRLPHDAALAQKLMTEAGYADGFELGMDCPNDRYVNDAAICQAVVAMLARIGVKVNLLAQTKGKYFEKVLSRNTSFYLLAWQPSSYDSHSPILNIMSTREELVPAGKALKGQGSYNPGGYSNPRVDALGDQLRVELDPVKRQALIDEVFKIHKAEIPQIPLHQQALSWGVKASIDIVQRADDSLELQWVRVR